MENPQRGQNHERKKFHYMEIKDTRAPLQMIKNGSERERDEQYI